MPPTAPTLVAAPGPFVTGEDNLRVRAWGSAAGVTLTVTARTLSLDGELRPIVKDFAASADRTLTSQAVRLEKGWLTNVLVLATAGTPGLGRVFVVVDLIRGIDGGVTHVATLAAGYVSATQALAWPGAPIETSIAGAGAIRSITGTNPAAGVEIIETVPAGARWRLHSIAATLTTSATAANRVVNWAFDDGALTYYQATAAALQAASLVRQYVAAAAGGGGSTLDVTIAAPLPLGRVLAAGHRILTLTTNLQAGDNWGAPQLLVEEWIEP